MADSMAWQRPMMPTLRTCLCLLMTPLPLSTAVQVNAATRLPEPGSYCLKEEVEGLGKFLMKATVRKTRSGYAVSFMNVMPDSPQILQAETERARVLADGSLAFLFTDGWGNRGRARIRASGRVDLTVIQHAPGNQITRNYGTHILSRASCSAPEFARGW